MNLPETFAARLAAADRPLVGLWVCSGSPVMAAPHAPPKATAPQPATTATASPPNPPTVATATVPDQA